MTTATSPTSPAKPTRISAAKKLKRELAEIAMSHGGSKRTRPRKKTFRMYPGDEKLSFFENMAEKNVLVTRFETLKKESGESIPLIILVVDNGKELGVALTPEQIKRIKKGDTVNVSFKKSKHTERCYDGKITLHSAAKKVKVRARVKVKAKTEPPKK